MYYYLNQIISNITVLLSGSANISLEEVVVSILIKFFLPLSTPETNKLKLLPSKISSTPGTFDKFLIEKLIKSL